MKSARNPARTMRIAAVLAAVAVAPVFPGAAGWGSPAGPVWHLDRSAQSQCGTSSRLWGVTGADGQAWAVGTAQGLGPGRTLVEYYC